MCFVCFLFTHDYFMTTLSRDCNFLELMAGASWPGGFTDEDLFNKNILSAQIKKTVQWIETKKMHLIWEFRKFPPTAFVLLHTHKNTKLRVFMHEHRQPTESETQWR